MMRSLGTTGDPDLYRTLQALSTHANRIGTRLAVIRSVAASEMKASTDPLTGLANRRTLDLRLAALLGGQEPFALAMIDVDHFKQINDTHGHDTGDRVLKVLATTLQGSVRRDDLVCRFGGEEFVLVLPGTDIGRAAEVVEQVRAELPRAAAKAGVPAVTVSVGIVDQGFGADAEGILRAADELLYQAKRDGRDRVIVDRAA
jgi:diguanylate cyclase (GGDEF)-like protein